MSPEFCKNCGKEKGENVRCDFCGFKEELSDQKNQADKPRTLDVWLERCPVCKFGKILRYSKRVFFKIFNKKYLECESCGAIFSQIDSTHYKLKHVLKDSNEVWKLYGGFGLKEREWITIAEGGMSDRLQHKVDLENWERKFSLGEISLKDAKLNPEDFSSSNPPIILKRNEEFILALKNITLKETRMVSNRQYMSFGKIGNVRVGGYVGGSKPVMKNIDVGELCLTSKRLVFVGRNKNVISQLNKIMKVNKYLSGISVTREGKTKTQFYTGNGFDKQLLINIEGRKYDIKLHPSLIVIEIKNLIKQ